MNALQGITQGAQPAMQPQNALSGMQSAQPQQSPKFNGTVTFQGQPIQVSDGLAQFGGENFTVSDDGRVVANEKRQFVGTILNGKFVMATPEIIDQFKKQGVFEK
jgi:hypothetical protein